MPGAAFLKYENLSFSEHYLLKITRMHKSHLI